VSVVASELFSALGVPRRYLAAEPSLGVEIQRIVPGGVTWELLALTTVFTTSATVANRRVRLRITDGSQPVYAAIAPLAHGASTTLVYRYLVGVGVTIDGTAQFEVMATFPRTVLLPGWVIETETASIQAGDDYTAPTLYVLERPLPQSEEVRTSLQILPPEIGASAFAG
jgi:hypothetical protein